MDDSPAHSRTPLAGDRTRRSYPSLQHISLAPLSTKFPLDDDDGGAGNGSTEDNASYFTAHVPTASYLASSSVPTTPGILADSRNVSYTNLAKRKKLSTDDRPPLSDTRLDDMQLRGPLHHHYHHNGQQPPRHHRRAHTSRPRVHDRRDSEWLLRAGLAMSSSAREEKGQSWLVKRESSTSLVSDTRPGEDPMQYSEYGRNASRRQRSGVSTPSPSSRRQSVSQPGSRRGSRPDMGMTTLDSGPQAEPSVPSDQAAVYPDFVDEAVRQQAASVVVDGAQDVGDLVSNIASDTEFSDAGSVEFDEAEMQRLTRQRGFGLGSWIDRLVEWTLFSVEDDYSTNGTGVTTAAGNGEGAVSRGQTEDFGETEHEDVVADSDSGSETHVVDVPAQVECPGDKGGWADARWLLGIVRRAAL